jgi:hypothetical protein
MAMNIREDYAEQLRAEHHNSKWGSTGWKYAGQDVITLLTQRPYIKTVLDYGCGKSTMRNYVDENFYDSGRLTWTEYDPGMPGLDVLPKGRYDLVLSTDVLEHVETDLLPEVLDYLQERTGTVSYHNIACYPTGKLFSTGPYAGKDLHLTLWEPEEWREEFKVMMPELHELEYRHVERARRGIMIPRAVLIHERR